MQLGNNRFKLLKEGGMWNAPSDEEEKILALQSEVKKLKVDKKSPLNKEKTVKKSTAKGKPKKAQLEKPSWFSIKPKEDELRKPKFWNNRNWWYCSPKTGGKCNGKYRVHKPSECEGKAYVSTPEKKAS